MHLRKLLLAVAIILIGFLSSCEESVDPTAKEFKIGMMAEKFGDSSYNDSCKNGVQDAVKKLSDSLHQTYNFIAEYKEGVADSIMKANANYFIKNNFDLLFFTGFHFDKYAQELAQNQVAGAKTKFVIIDTESETMHQNVEGIIFDVQEAAFPLGYLAAYWADLKSPNNPKTATICGYDSKTLKSFYIAFENGVKYYNSKYGKNVQNQTVFSNTFLDEEVGKNIANNLIDNGVSVIFNVAGECGVGAMKAVKARNKWAIGVDEDQYLSRSEVASVLLSSCIKDTRNAIYEIAVNAMKGKFNGGQIYKANLENTGVRIAPFHDYENQIPANIKSEINAIISEIKSGKIKTI
mgnify:CR=1 FL=1